jgi:hypothetical protein
VVSPMAQGAPCTADLLRTLSKKPWTSMQGKLATFGNRALILINSGGPGRAAEIKQDQIRYDQIFPTFVPLNSKSF